MAAKSVKQMVAEPALTEQTGNPDACRKVRPTILPFKLRQRGLPVTEK